MQVQLTEDQARYVARAREVLSGELTSGSAADYAERAGALQWHLSEMLALIDELTGGPQS